MKMKVATGGGELSTVDEEPLSPTAQILHVPGLNCFVIAVMGCKTRIDPGVVIEGLEHTLIKHPRFSSKLVADKNNRRKLRWVKTTVKAEDHVIVPDINPEMESADLFVDDYISNFTSIPMDMSRPLWELHLLNVKTSDADAVAVFRIHHSIGDGMSLISLLLACARKTSDPDSLPTVPEQRRRPSTKNYSDVSWRRIWWVFMAVWWGLVVLMSSVVDVLIFAATLLFLKDTENPLKGDGEGNARVFIHRTISLDDIKLVKNVMNASVNDVILGVTQAGLSKYIHRKYRNSEDKKGEMINIPKKMRVRGAIMVNIRKIPGIQVLADMMRKGSNVNWGNCIGYILLPFTIALQQHPLDYIRMAKSTIDCRKQSYEAILSYHTAKFILDLLGPKAAADALRRVFSNTTMTFSNMVGPVEEISFFGHPMAYLAPSVYGLPHALTLHFQSYMNKMTISVAVDPAVIPDPHQLCNDLEDSLNIIKLAASKYHSPPP